MREISYSNGTTVHAHVEICKRCSLCRNHDVTVQDRAGFGMLCAPCNVDVRVKHASEPLYRRTFGGIAVWETEQGFVDAEGDDNA